MKKSIISALLFFALFITTSNSNVSASTKFNDVSPTNWAYESINYLESKNVINGYGNGKFGPNDKVTRAQAAVMLTRALGYDTNNRPNPQFTDVPTTHYAYQDIATLVDKGIFVKDTKFNPNQQMKRGEMAFVLVRAYSFKGEYMGIIKDVTKYTALYSAVSALADQQITVLDEKAQFKPNNSLTRAEFSAFLARAMDPKFIQSSIKSDFIANAKKGIIAGCSIPYNKKTTIDYVRKTLGQPIDEDYLNGGYGLFYGKCTYFFDGDMSGIIYYPNERNLTPEKLKQIIGQPTEEGINDINEDWGLSYDFGKNALFINADNQYAPIRSIFFKGSPIR